MNIQNSRLGRVFAALMVVWGMSWGAVNANPKEGAQAKNPDEDIAKIIIHHVMDSHDWHITDVGETAISIPLPWIIYNSEKGLQFFTNTHALNEDPNYVVSHDKLYYVKGEAHVDHHAAEADHEHYVVDH